MTIDPKSNIKKLFIDSVNRHIARRKQDPEALLGCPIHYDIAVDFGLIVHDELRLENLLAHSRKMYPKAPMPERLDYCKHALYNDFISECCDFDVTFNPQGQAVVNAPSEEPTQTFF